jgi:hypothetical protein
MFGFVDGVRGVRAADVKRVAFRYLSRKRAVLVYGRPVE